jgi:hypothetical protein
MFSERIDFAHERAFLAARGRGATTRRSAVQHEAVTAPLLTESALRTVSRDFPQRGLLGEADGGDDDGDLVFFNTNAPNSGVICGVQVSTQHMTQVDSVAGPLTKTYRALAKATPSAVFSRTL